VVRANPDRFRLFGPDEVSSNRLDDVFDVTDRAFVATTHNSRTSTSQRARVTACRPGQIDIPAE
jgi:phosphoketolase